MERLRSHLADHTERGFAYRVDFRLRPYGRVSSLAHSLSSISDYYRNAASDWERQALIKLRPVAGDLTFGAKALAALISNMQWPNNAMRIAGGIRKLRDVAAARRSIISKGVDIKSGEGGIRDIEFLVQGLQLMYVHRFPEVLSQNTLTALEKLTALKIIPSDKGEALKVNYLYLRRVEHFLQLLEDRQVHAVPTDPGALDALARRIEEKGRDSAQFKKHITETMRAVRSIYDELLPLPACLPAVRRFEA